MPREMPEHAEPDVRVMRHGKQEALFGGEQIPTYEQFQAAWIPGSEWSLETANPLSEAGRQQVHDRIESLGQELSTVRLVLTSPALRTRQTAVAAADLIQLTFGHAVEVRESPLLGEVRINPNAFSRDEYDALIRDGGLTRVIQRINEMFFADDSRIGQTISYNYAQAKRFLTFLRRIKKYTAHERVLVVTHGYVGPIIADAAHGGDPASFLSRHAALGHAESFALHYSPSVENFTVVAPSDDRGTER